MTRRRSQADEAALLQVLGQSPIFRQGRPEALAAVVASATPFDYPVGSFLMRQGEPADHVLVLTAGEVAIVSPVRGGGELVHTIMRAG
ncbi:MAG TPA: cyclic nucleotide-binding domain-containing protein, partial [Actinomycetota bacterium]|nr:cyclic nucleotide-binding domain-containing protein [Actinomycetota bacterium]